MSDLGNEPSPKIRTVKVKDYYLYELAYFYKVSKYRMRRKMEPFIRRIGKPNGYLYSVEQVTLIFSLIKLPPDVKPEW